MATENTAWHDNWTQLTPGTQAANITQEPNGNSKLEQFWYPGSTTAYDAQNSYSFDDANRLTKYTGELHDSAKGWQDTETYHYDGDGRRVDWTSSVCAPYNGGTCTGTTTTNYKQYEYVGGSVVGERTKGGMMPVWYIYGKRGEKLYSVHWSNYTTSLRADTYVMDHLGSVREVVGPWGVTANWYNYDPYGLPVAQSTQVTNSYQFASAPLDATNAGGTWYTGFYNLNARLYNPQSGRFLSQDTYMGSPWAPWTQNLFAYANGNPVNMVDPTGHTPIVWNPGMTTIDLSNMFVMGLLTYVELNLLRMRVLSSSSTAAISASPPAGPTSTAGPAPGTVASSPPPTSVSDYPAKPTTTAGPAPTSVDPSPPPFPVTPPAGPTILSSPAPGSASTAPSVLAVTNDTIGMTDAQAQAATSDPSQLQHGYNHVGNFLGLGNYNPDSGEQFKAIVQNTLTHPDMVARGWVQPKGKAVLDVYGIKIGDSWFAVWINQSTGLFSTSVQAYPSQLAAWGFK